MNDQLIVYILEKLADLTPNAHAEINLVAAPFRARVTLDRCEKEHATLTDELTKSPKHLEAGIKARLDALEVEGSKAAAILEALQPKQESPQQ